MYLPLGITSHKQTRQVLKIGTKKMSTQNSKAVATEILKQLGGNKFIAMTGTKKFGCTENSLSFKVGMRCKNKITHVEIKLNGLDLYDVTFLRWYDYKVTTIEKCENVYFDMLQKLFTEKTGLDTHL